MTTKDEKLGEELAELARQLLLWLQDNDLPAVPGLRMAMHDDFRLYAGTYHRLDRFGGKLLPNLWANQPDEQRRMQALRLGISHVLLVGNPNEDVTLPDGRTYGSNRIVLTKRPPDGVTDVPIDRPGALMTVKPQLSSRTADDPTLGRTQNYDFAVIRDRVDLVYDDAATAAALGFRYPYLLDYQTPRRIFEANVQDVPIPQQLEPPPGPLHDRVLAQRIREFREYLYHNATYHNRRRVAERGGDYYGKYRAKVPLDKRQRQFRPTLLSDDYLTENFIELVMKRGDDLLLIDLPDSRHLYRLLWEPQQGRTPKLTVQFLATIGGAAGGAATKEPELPVNAVVFRAVDGADEPPTQVRFGNLDYKGGLPEELVVDYKAFLRWYYNDQRLRYRSDAEWLDAFVDVFFGDQTYPVELSTIPVHAPDREPLFLGALRQAAGEGPPGPIKDRLAELVAWCDDPKMKDQRFVFTQGMMINGRQLLGITPRFDVFEWHPDTEHVTVMKIERWLAKVRLETISADVYRNTAGMLPIITLVTWGGVVVMTGGLVGVPASMTVVSRTAITKLVTHVAGSQVAKNAAVAARRILIAELAESAMSLVPKSDPILHEFIRGLFAGFGGGAAEHYLSETDERLKRMVNRIPRYVANYVTKNGYQAYVVYDKVRNALIKITGVIRALRTVLVDQRAQLVSQQLARLSHYAGVGILIVLFVVVYLDWVYRSRPGIELDKWVKKQKQTLQWMVEQTGDEIANFAKELRNDLLTIGDPKSPAATAAVRKHDQRLTAAVTSKLRDGIRTLPAIAEFLQMLLERMGIKNWQELQQLGFVEVMERGVAALPTGGFAADQARKLGEAFGELVGTLMLERKIVPDNVKANTGWVFDRRQSHGAAKTALAGGTWRALWEFAIHPFEDLGNLPGSLKRGLENQGGLDKGKLVKVSHRDTAYRDFVQSLIGNEEELARRLAKLAEDAGLEGRIRTMVGSAVAKIDPPSLLDLTKNENPDWPTDAIMFLLYTWLRIGLRQLLEMFHFMEDGQPYGNLFKLSDLFDILGLDIALDDQTLASLKATFVRQL
ncbi:MAG TPA: hypothetical protein VFB84_07100 [Micromonosporaceae bacterium]|nr:hypothetical protein [Micromonosporaceae bacterium]